MSNVGPNSQEGVVKPALIRSTSSVVERQGLGRLLALLWRIVTSSEPPFRGDGTHTCVSSHVRSRIRCRRVGGGVYKAKAAQARPIACFDMFRLRSAVLLKRVWKKVCR